MDIESGGYNAGYITPTRLQDGDTGVGSYTEAWRKYKPQYLPQPCLLENYIAV